VFMLFGAVSQLYVQQNLLTMHLVIIWILIERCREHGSLVGSALQDAIIITHPCYKAVVAASPWKIDSSVLLCYFWLCLGFDSCCFNGRLKLS